MAQTFASYEKVKNDHPFLSCSYLITIWHDLEILSGKRSIWIGHMIEAILKTWIENRDLKPWRALPFLVLWGIWLGHNLITFKDNLRPSFQFLVQIWALMSYFKTPSEN